MIARLMVSALLFGISASQAQEQNRDNNIATAKVTDRENVPIEGASIYKLNWIETQRETPTTVLSDSFGVFKFTTEPIAPMHSNFVIIHKDGFGFGALDLDTLPARVRLYPARRTIALRILDAKGLNVGGAQVMLGEINFDDDFLVAMLPRALAIKTGAVTRPDGWATLRNLRPTPILSLVVEAEGYGAQIFPCDLTDETKFRKLQLQETTAIEVKLMMGDVPASGWKVVTMGKDEDRFGRRKEKKAPEESIPPSGVLHYKVADVNGTVILEHALADQDIDLILIDESNQHRGSVKTKAEKEGKAPLIIQVPKKMKEIGQEKLGQVVDVKTNEPVGGFHLRFTSSKWPDQPYDSISDEHGILKLKLLPGEWHVHVEKAAPGYCGTLTSNLKIVVKDEEGERLANFACEKAKELTGTIHGIDLALHRARWMKVDWTKGDQNRGFTYGVVHADSTFHVNIPESASAEEFSIVRRAEHDGRLRVQSREPLVLTGE